MTPWPLRRFNHERIYLRPESLAQADGVIAMLRALVEHYIERPGDLPDCRRASPAGLGIRRRPRPPAVAYVDGMTDRFACAQAVSLLEWPDGPVALGPGHRRHRR